MTPVSRCRRLAVFKDVGNHEELGKARTAAILSDVVLELAEAAAECDVLFRRQLLVAEEHDLVLVKPVDDFAEYGVVEVFGKIDAEDFGAERCA